MPAFDPAKLPPALRSVAVPPGTHRGGFKSMIHGPAKSGKSFWLASQPNPILALACGENGIGMYLDKEAGDYVIQVHDANTFDKAVRFIGKNEKDFASIALDNGNIAFKQWLEHWERELKVDEIKGKNWKPTKESWNELTFIFMDTRLNVGMGFWPKGAKWESEEEPGGPPGVEPKTKLKITPQDLARAEEKIPFVIDMLFKSDIIQDAKGAPTPYHTITYFGGRRPKSVPPDKLYTGKQWKFDSRKPVPEGPWQHIVGPLIEHWGTGAVDHLDIDPSKAEWAEAEIRAGHEDTLVGQLLASISGAQAMDALKVVWTNAEADINQYLPPNKRAIVVAAKEAKKKELTK